PQGAAPLVLDGGGGGAGGEGAGERKRVAVARGDQLDAAGEDDLAGEGDDGAQVDQGADHRLTVTVRGVAVGGEASAHQEAGGAGGLEVGDQVLVAAWA